MPNAYATASVLIIAILALNLLAYALMRRFAVKASR
jgi:ABC-type phosphate transport system permease subunit